MKKISLLLGLFLCLGFSKVFAGSFTIMNATPCPFEFYSGVGTIVDPATGATYYFSFGPILNPGSTSNPFANPSLLPGFSSNAPASVQASGCVTAIKAIGPGATSIYLTNSTPFTSFTSTNNPACNTNSNNYIASWNVGGNSCDVVVFIF
ncbi:hypothetical protein [Taibaiella chishuiensis]|uniref:Uncharacterized protein n=1 Tax=Taibaiella chishuiensis TaxID=1434707 RepID=A0A2P8CT77_9BACT|nr:hypothetical protein [Taibaiella chishuiensis]PSK88168.1 hypothetical protein B0I18_11562 [Taibaiella chishuiensis]